jgi:uncharacterized membrane protein YdfJ with MMPL/SSD domain
MKHSSTSILCVILFVAVENLVAEQLQFISSQVNEKNVTELIVYYTRHKMC